MRVLFAALFPRLLILLRVIGPYAAIELLLPGGTLIALLYWWYRSRVILHAPTDPVGGVGQRNSDTRSCGCTARAPGSVPESRLTCS